MEHESIKKIYPSGNQAISLSLKLILFSILIAIPFYTFKILAKDYIDQDDEYINGFITLITYMLPFLIIIHIGLKKIRAAGRPDYEINLNKPTVTSGTILVFMTIALMILVEPLQSLIPMSETFYELMNSMLKPTLFNFFTIVIAAPILEEIVFRGIILEGFLKNYSPWKAIFWSSLLFGAVHLNPWQAVTAISLGMLMGWLYYKTGSITRE